jgi:hypothetical protein
MHGRLFTHNCKQAVDLHIDALPARRDKEAVGWYCNGPKIRKILSRWPATTRQVPIAELQFAPGAMSANQPQPLAALR